MWSCRWSTKTSLSLRWVRWRLCFLWIRLTWLKLSRRESDLEIQILVVRSRSVLGKAFGTIQRKVSGNCWQGKDVQIQIFAARKLVAAGHLNSPKCDFACHFWRENLKECRTLSQKRTQEVLVQLGYWIFQVLITMVDLSSTSLQIRALSILMSSSCSTAFLLTLDIKFLQLLSYSYVLLDFLLLS